MLKRGKASLGGGLRQLESHTVPEQIDERLCRFYRCVNQTMISHLFEKFKTEL